MDLARQLIQMFRHWEAGVPFLGQAKRSRPALSGRAYECTETERRD